MVSDDQAGLRCVSQTKTGTAGAHRPISPSRAPNPRRNVQGAGCRIKFVTTPKAACQSGISAGPSARPPHRCPELPAAVSIISITEPPSRKGTALSPEPQYDQSSDTYRHIYKSHPNATAVTNSEGTTVFFDPDTHEVLGFQIVNFSEYYKNHQTPDGEFEIVLPARVPVNLEEEMDFDVESLTSGVRIAEIY